MATETRLTLVHFLWFEDGMADVYQKLADNIAARNIGI